VVGESRRNEQRGGRVGGVERKMGERRGSEKGMGEGGGVRRERNS